MTVQQLTYICAAVYFNPPKALLKLIPSGELTLGAFARTLLAQDKLEITDCGPLGECPKQLLIELLKTDPLARLRVLAYINRNDTTGFVGYALAHPENGVIVALRGSESRGACVPGNIDWRDNFTAPFEGSVQYPEIERFVNCFRTGDLLITGHSKGAHNAMYGLSKAKNERARCIAFNGQGFSIRQMTPPMCNRLKANCTNYVVENDPVGALLDHPEARIFVKKTGDYHPHELCSYAFDEAGEPIPGKRPCWSRLLEGATAAYVDGHLLLEGAQLPGWLMKLLRSEKRLEKLTSGAAAIESFGKRVGVGMYN